MKIIHSYLLTLIVVSGISIMPLTNYGQISSTSLVIVPSPIIDSVGYDCSSGQAQVYVTNQVGSLIYSVESAVPAIGSMTSNSNGLFSMTGVTDAVFIVNNGTCYTDYVRHFDCNNTPLPVIITDFEARLYKENQALISWNIAHEIEVKQYVLEESNDGKNFRYLQTFSAVGEKHYEYIDKILSQGYNYYRLKIVNDDEAFSYSPVRFVIYNQDRQLIWYPNPAEKFVYLEFYNTDNTDYMYAEVFNSISGLQVFTKKYKLTSGLNKVAIDVRSLTDGSYFLVYAIGKQSKTGSVKFVKITR